MTGTLIKKKTSKNREYFYINLSFKDPLTKEWKTKTVRTGLQVQGNKRKAEKMIPDMIEKYQHLEEAALTRETATRNITLCDYLDIWLEEKKHEVNTPPMKDMLQGFEASNAISSRKESF